MIATETLYRTADGRLVREGDPAAAFLVCRRGVDVPRDVVKKYGLKLESEPVAENPVARENRAISGRSIRRRSEPTE